MAAITFSDVLFVPKYSEVMSRSEVDTSSYFEHFDLDLPVISSNMKDITGPEMVREMALRGGLGILHRFHDDYMTDYRAAKALVMNDRELSHLPPETLIGVSVGVQEKDKQRFLDLLKAGAKIFCVDVAHGHHILVKNMIKYMRSQTYLGEICIIAGNIATTEAADDLYHWGANVLKVGIGPGSCCQTRNNTGVGVPQLSALKEIRQYLKSNDLQGKVKIIADGGLKTSGDIAKAMAYADAVMVAGMLAGTAETPGHVYTNEKNEMYKTVGGSASGERKVGSGQKKAFVEGMVKEVPFRGKAKYILQGIKQGLQSSFSYSGANNLAEFHEKAELRQISGGGKSESKM